MKLPASLLAAAPLGASGASPPGDARDSGREIRSRSRWRRGAAAARAGFRGVGVPFGSDRGTRRFSPSARSLAASRAGGRSPLFRPSADSSSPPARRSDKYRRRSAFDARAVRERGPRIGGLSRRRPARFVFRTEIGSGAGSSRLASFFVPSIATVRTIVDDFDRRRHHRPSSKPSRPSFPGESSPGGSSSPLLAHPRPSIGDR